MQTRFTPQDQAREETGITLLEVMSILLRNRYLVIGLPLALAMLVVGWRLIQPRTWTATGQFIAQGPETPGGSLAGLAAQLGVSVPTMAQSQSPEFYEALIRSRDILAATVADTYTVRTSEGTVHGTLVEHFEVEESNDRLARQLALEALEDRIVVSLGRGTGIVRFDVITEEPELSFQIASKIMDKVHAFDLEIRQTQAKAEREFIEGRVNAAQRELRQAEEQLVRFQQENARFRSPALQQEMDHLTAQVSLRQQVYTELAGSYERARIEEVRNTPVITVVQRPEVPVRPDRRGTIARGMVALIIGTLLGIFLAFARAFTRRERRSAPEQYEELQQLKAESLNDLQKPFSWMRRRAKAV